jgi:hypothetical protein
VFFFMVSTAKLTLYEIGHACNLLYTSDSANLMYPDCTVSGRDRLSGFQKSITRGSKYLTYF